MFNKQAQLRRPYQGYLLLQSRQLIKQMSPESRAELLLTIEARAELMGEDIKNNEIYNILRGKEQGDA